MINVKGIVAVDATLRGFPSSHLPANDSGGGGLAVLLVVGLRRCGSARSPPAPEAGSRPDHGRPWRPSNRAASGGVVRIFGVAPLMFRLFGLSSRAGVGGIRPKDGDGCGKRPKRGVWRTTAMSAENDDDGQGRRKNNECKSLCWHIDGSQSVMWVETGAPQPPAGLGRSCGPSGFGPVFGPGCRRRLGAVARKGGRSAVGGRGREARKVCRKSV